MGTICQLGSLSEQNFPTYSLKPKANATLDYKGILNNALMQYPSGPHVRCVHNYKFQFNQLNT